ncbi:MAG: zinc-binding dehydrogenase [Phycisphaeraceae bacterium]|nr:zinc-binding dehydrogenase [Phycisphaeraceae bacterium]
MNRSEENIITFTGTRKVELLTRPINRTPLAEDEIAGPTRISLISPGTEVQGQLLAEKFPIEPGYAATFTVEQVGAKVSDLAVGDTVICSGPAGIGGHHGWQRCPRQAAIKLPDGLSPRIGVWARLIGVGLASMAQTQARPPQRVGIFGLGPVGHLVAQAVNALGYEAVGIDPDAGRRSMAADKGIAAFADRAEVMEKGGGEVAVTLECSGFEQAVFDACHLTQKRGEVFIIGVPWRKREEFAVFDLLHPLFRRCLAVRCGWEWSLPRYPLEVPCGSVFGNMEIALKLLAAGKVDVEGLGDLIPADDAATAYQKLADRTHPLLSSMLDWS